MGKSKGIIKLNYNLKSKLDEYTLVYLIGYNKSQRFKISTKQRVYVKSWNVKTQRCTISSDYSERINRNGRKVNKFLDKLDNSIDDGIGYFNSNDPSYFGTAAFLKNRIQIIIDNILEGEREEQEKQLITPLKFFKEYVDNLDKKVDMRTGRFISERTIGHYKCVLHRFQSFFEQKRIKDDFSVFNNRFQEEFTNWAYTSKNYRYNTIPSSFSILKVWLNEASRKGLMKDDAYKSYHSKANEVDNIYLTEEEIGRLYALDIPQLKKNGIIDLKSTIEETRDLFIIGCWTGLRQSDLNHLDKALFDINDETITIITEKTAEKITIPMHVYIKELYKKYDGKFPKMCYKSRFNEHLRELGRLAAVDDEVVIKETKGGKVSTIKQKKYKLIKSHTARRSFATNLYLKGAPTISIMKLTGHTTEENFMKYIKVSREENAEFMRQYFK